MALKLVAFSPSPARARAPFHGSLPAASPLPLFLRQSPAVPLQLLPQVWPGSRSSSAVTALKKEGSDAALLDGQVGFQPFKEIQRKDLAVPVAPHLSLAKHLYSDPCEIAVNDQINVEYSVSYVYHAMYAYFSRDNIALNGLAKFFKESSAEEREHAEKLMEYQNKRGGKVTLRQILTPFSEFDNAEKGDALNAMELALALEKLTNEKLLKLHHVAKTCNDTQMEDYIESEFLTEQVESIKKIAEYVAQLRRVGKGHGVWHFDQMLLQEVSPA